MIAIVRQQLAQLLMINTGRGKLTAVLPGILASCVIGGLAFYVTSNASGFLHSSPLFTALIFGLIIGNTFDLPATWSTGLNFIIRRVLRSGVVLVGFQITLGELFGFGIEGIIVALVAVTSTILFGYLLFVRLFKLDYTTSFLVIIGTAICGAAAIFATAPILNAKHHQTVIAVTVITILGTLAMLIMPVLYNFGLFGPLNESTYGVLSGASLHEVVQVVGAGYNVSDTAGNAATIVKLSRVLLLIPVLLILTTFLFHGKKSTTQIRQVFPWFILGFIVVVTLNSSIELSEQNIAAIKLVTTFLFVLVMTALGLQTRFRDLRQLSAKMIIAPVILFAFLFAVSSSLAYSFNAMGFGANMFTPSNFNLGYSVTIPDTRIDGERLFHQTGCAKCHTPYFEVEGRRIYVYSDLLLHDMGPDLDDKIVQGDALGQDWRTTPLWGLHTRKQFLHDGRATTLREAILAHGGEAQIVRDRFFDLNETDKQQLYSFLENL